VDEGTYVGVHRNHAGARRPDRAWRALVVLALLAASSLSGCAGATAPNPARGDQRDPPTPAEQEKVSVEEIAGRPYKALGVTQFAGRDVSATMIRGCGRRAERCDAAVLLTRDGWATHVDHVVPSAQWVWTQLLPDGSVAFVPDGNAAPGVLHADAAVTPLTVSTRRAAATDSSLVVSGPPSTEGPPRGAPWVLEPGSASLHPLRTDPPGRGIPGAVAVGDVTVVATMTDPWPPPVTVAINRSSDNGRTWDTATLTSHSRAASLCCSLVTGPKGRMALWFTSDGATVAPLVELWTTSDAGRSWTRMRPTRAPTFVSRMAYAPDGTLLMVEERGRAEDPDLMWRTTADGSDLEPAPDLPVGIGITASGGVLYQQTPDGLLVSEDGVAWRAVDVP
jgi:hypothetical protein